MKILFIGPQGSGKSTQAKLLADYLRLPYISTGEILREISMEDFDRGYRIRQTLEKGELVDDKTVSELVKKRVEKMDCKDGFVFDGYPRTLNQINYFDPGLDKVFYLRLTDEDATKRLLSRGRQDDTPKLIKERLDIYHSQTDPILDYYKNKGILQVLDGKKTIKQIHMQIREGVNG